MRVGTPPSPQLSAPLPPLPFLNPVSNPLDCYCAYKALKRRDSEEIPPELFWSLNFPYISILEPFHKRNFPKVIYQTNTNKSLHVQQSLHSPVFIGGCRAESQAFPPIETTQVRVGGGHVFCLTCQRQENLIPHTHASALCRKAITSLESICHTDKYVCTWCYYMGCGVPPTVLFGLAPASGHSIPLYTCLSNTTPRPGKWWLLEIMTT